MMLGALDGCELSREKLKDVSGWLWSVASLLSFPFR